MKDKNIPARYRTSEQALARINELEAALGVPKTASVEYIEDAWLRIDTLQQVPVNKPANANASPAALPAAAPQPARASAPTEQRPILANGAELTGVNRAIAANVRLQASRK